jgi:hypothetical protein
MTEILDTIQFMLKTDSGKLLFGVFLGLLIGGMLALAFGRPR